MAIMDLVARIREARDERTGIIPVLMGSLARSDIRDPPGPRSWMGVSRIPTLCPRALVMAHRLGIKLSDSVDLKGRWNMDRGTAFHIVTQELWLGPTGYFLGGWQCPRCGHTHGGVPGVGIDGEAVITVRFDTAVPMPEKCVGCELKNGKWHRFRFVEPELRDHDLLVMGKGDGLFHLPPGPVEVLDIKTTGTDFDKTYTSRSGVYSPSLREAPRKTDAGQLQWYLDVAGLRTGRILYLNPGAADIETAMVEHEVAYDPVYMHREKEKVRGLREALEDRSKPVPPCPYDGAGAYGECQCVEVAVLWASSWR